MPETTTFKPAPPPDAGSENDRILDRRMLKALAAFLAGLAILFIGPLSNLVKFAFSQERNSYLLLIPGISAYLIWIKRADFNDCGKKPMGRPIAFIPALMGLIALVGASVPKDAVDRLSLQIFAFLSFALAGAFIFVRPAILRRIVFPLAFLIFMTPMPTAFGDAIEIFLQHTSAVAASWMLGICQVPMLHDGLDFLLPGISIRVAQECSGYNSTFALFIVSTLAGHFFLKSTGRKVALSAAVIPLAILRNGFRITTIAILCVYVDPKMIHSYIHHKGGPIFFALSLIPFFALLWFLRKSEVAKSGAKTDRK
jgi:exosortase C (VPDSG-CTERM-specific)